MIKVLFDLKKEYYFNSLFPLYQVMEPDPDYELWFHVGQDHKRYFKLFLIPQRSRIEARLKTQGYQTTSETRGFDVVVCGDALEKPGKYGNCLRVHLDHGMGIKTLRIRNIKRQAGYRYQVFLEGHYWFDYIKSLGWESCADFHLTGLPKLDPFFWPGYYNNADLVTRLGLAPDKKTVLFAPSYRPSCITYLKDKILDLLPEYNLIVKLHPYSWGGKYASHAHHRLYEQWARQKAGLFLVPKDEYDVYPYLYLADTLISDTSSVLNEFLALGKHGIVYELPDRRPRHSDGMPILSLDPREWLAGAFPHISSPTGLSPAVSLALHPDATMRQKLSAYRDYFFTGLDGKSSERVKKVVDNLVKKY